MNLLKDSFISTTQGKVSLRDILTSDEDYQLQYFFDETQLAMLQMLSSLATVVLKPSVSELKGYIENGLTPEQYDQALSRVETKWFEDDCFMRSSSAISEGFNTAKISKLVSGIECGTSKDASGLFSNMEEVKFSCADCIHVLNYNLHMNISGQYFSKFGSSGIRGGGVVTTLITGKSLSKTILFNVVVAETYYKYSPIEKNTDNTLMWASPPKGRLYSAKNININRGLFALAYHVNVETINEKCICDICGSFSADKIDGLKYLKYQGQYGSVRTDRGKENGAGLWLHPYTPRRVTDNGIFSLTPYGLNWQSWQDLSSFVANSEINSNSEVVPAYIVTQFKEIFSHPINILVGSNITKKASIIGRVYDLYSMPSSLIKNNRRVSKVVDAGLKQKECLSKAFSYLFKKDDVGYDTNFVGRIKEQAMNRFTSNAQQIVQKILYDVDRKEAAQLEKEIVNALSSEAKAIFKSVQRKYQHDLPLFKALVKGECMLYKTDH